jgi:hypothetical protein
MRPSLFVIIFAAALMIRLTNIALLGASPDALLVEDARLYWDSATALMAQGYDSVETVVRLLVNSERAPGYILFLAGLRELFGDSFGAILIVQSILDSLSCILIATIGAAVPSSLAPRLALVSGLIAAATPNLVIHSGMILSDTLFLFLFAVTLAAGARFLQNGSPRWATIAALSLGLAIVTRTLVLPLPLLMAPIAFAAPLMKGRRMAACIGISIMFMGISLAPATYIMKRHYSDFGAFTLSSQNGAHLAGWLAPLVRRAHDGTPRDQGAAFLNEKIQTRMKADGVDEFSLNKFERSRAISAYAMEELATYPLMAFVKAWGAGVAVNLGAPASLLDPRVRALPHSSFDRTGGGGVFGQISAFITAAAPAFVTIALASFAGMALISLLQVYGLVRLFQMALWPSVLATLCIGYFLLVTGPIGSPKYRLPFEPVLILLTGLALVDLYGRVFGARSR